MSRYRASYIRESLGEDTAEAREGQRSDIRQLAQRDGIDPTTLVEFDDWSRSGSERATRPAQDRMLAEVKAGRVSVIYAQSMDRLMRSTRLIADLLDAVDSTGTQLVTQREGEVKQDNPSAWMFVQSIMTAAEYESRVGRVRAKHGTESRKRNALAHRESCPGSDMCGNPQAHYWGTVPYGDLPGENLSAVLEAFEKAGSYAGATGVLNAGDVKPRRGKAWESTSVMRIVTRSAELLSVTLPVRKHQGSRTLSIHTFARLIECPHDGSILTATNRSDRKGPSVGYFCRVARRSAVLCPEHHTILGRLPDWRWQCPRGHTLDRYAVTGDHPRPWSVGEHLIATWVREVLNTAIFASWKNTAEPKVAAEGAALDAKIARLGQAYVDGVVPEASYRTQLDGLREQRAALEGSERASVTFRMGIDWSLSPRELNAQLRDILHSVRLDDRMRPIGAVWLRQPTIADDDGEPLPNPDAQLVPGGWYLPYKGGPEGGAAKPTTSGQAASPAYVDLGTWTREGVAMNSLDGSVVPTGRSNRTF